MQPRIDKYTVYLKTLVSSRQYGFDENLRGSLPVEHGIYRMIENGADWNSSLRVGRTKSAKEGLRQRIYQNHYMGDQPGNIKVQLVKEGRFESQDKAKEYLKANCKVQFVVIEDYNERKWAEHFIISILQPQFTD